MGRVAMQSRHFVVSVYGDSHYLCWRGIAVKELAEKYPEKEVVVTEIAPNIYATSPLAMQVAEAMTRQITGESGGAG